MLRKKYFVYIYFIYYLFTALFGSVYILNQLESGTQTIYEKMRRL